eukprot:987774-Alexandrium_andersonii.AAC.1
MGNRTLNAMPCAARLLATVAAQGRCALITSAHQVHINPSASSDDAASASSFSLFDSQGGAGH